MPEIVNTDRLRSVLKRRGVTAEKLARLTGYRLKTVAAFLAGRREPPEAFAVVAEHVLKLPAGWLRPRVTFAEPDPPPVEDGWLS